jgi:uncharacterized FlaG/YvyC family protein
MMKIMKQNGIKIMPDSNEILKEQIKATRLRERPPEKPTHEVNKDKPLDFNYKSDMEMIIKKMKKEQKNLNREMRTECHKFGLSPNG